MREEMSYDISNGLDIVAREVPELYLMTVIYATLNRDDCEEVLVSKHRYESDD